MVSNLLLKQQNLLPFQFLVARLSLVRMTLFLRTKKYLNFKGIFVCQISGATLIYHYRLEHDIRTSP
jgi:hypothetical protein